MINSCYCFSLCEALSCQGSGLETISRNFVWMRSPFSFYYYSVLDKDVLSPPKTPHPFFPPGSPVLDYPWGDLMPVADILIREELLVVLYYAPWCEESMRARSEYSKAARFLQDKVKYHIQVHRNLHIKSENWT